MPNFIDLKDLKKDQLIDLISLSLKWKNNNCDQFMKDKNVVLIFEKPSLRTRISFEVGINQLGGNSYLLNEKEMQLGERETVEDTARVLERYADMVIIRCFGHDQLIKYANISEVPVINALSDLSHPCQILADLMTFKENSANELEKVCWIGDGNNVCNSYVEASKILDFELSIYCPKEYSPDPSFLNYAKENSSFANSREEAAKGADIITTDVWVSMGDEKTKERAFQGYFVDTGLIENTGKKSIFLHCLPAHRGQEITFELMEHPSSKVLQQAENRMHVQEALIENLLS